MKLIYSLKAKLKKKGSDEDSTKREQALLQVLHRCSTTFRKEDTVGR